MLNLKIIKKLVFIVLLFLIIPGLYDLIINKDLTIPPPQIIRGPNNSHSSIGYFVAYPFTGTFSNLLLNLGLTSYESSLVIASVLALLIILYIFIRFKNKYYDITYILFIATYSYYANVPYKSMVFLTFLFLAGITYKFNE